MISYTLILARLKNRLKNLLPSKPQSSSHSHVMLPMLFYDMWKVEPSNTLDKDWLFVSLVTAMEMPFHINITVLWLVKLPVELPIKLVTLRFL